MNSTGEGRWLEGSLNVPFVYVVPDLSVVVLSLYLCCLVASLPPLSGAHGCSVVDVVDFVHFHQLNRVIAKKISCSEGQVHVCECDAAQ